MSPGVILPLAAGVAIAWLWGQLARTLPAFPLNGLLAWALVSAEQAVIFAVGQMWLAAGIATGELGVALAIWWWRRRKDRRKALAALGARGKARIAAMVSAMRERARPRPVLRPGLQGAR